MNENNITKHKSIESIINRIRFRTDRYPRTVIFDYNQEGVYNLQIDTIQLEEGEHPLFEDYNRNGYTLLTTHYLYSIILNDKESPLLVKDQIFKVAINDIIYYKSISDIITEQYQRKNYSETLLKQIDTTTEQGAVLFYLRVGTVEFQFHEILRQLVCMNNFYKHLQKQ